MLTGTKLDTFKSQQKFCMDQYIPLRYNGNYMITLSVENNKQQMVVFNKIKSKSLEDFKVYRPNENLQKNMFIYYNDQYDFKWTSQSEVENVRVCDASANCFPMESADKKTFVIPDKYKQYLSSTPYIRIKADDLSKLQFENK